jgi:serine/threonine protein kinase
MPTSAYENLPPLSEATLAEPSALVLSDVPCLQLPASAAGTDCEEAFHPDMHRQYEPLATLGKGGYAVVVSVRHRESGQRFVVKKILNWAAGDVDAQRTVREVAFQRWAAHPNLLALVDVCYSRYSPDLYLLTPPMALDLRLAISAWCAPALIEYTERHARALTMLCSHLCVHTAARAAACPL